MAPTTFRDRLTGGDTPAYLLRRTGGVIGTLTRLIAEASLRVIGQHPTGPQTGEYLSREILASVALDHAAEHGDIPNPTEPGPTGHGPTGHGPTVPGPRTTGARRSRNSVFNGARPRRHAA